MSYDARITLMLRSRPGAEPHGFQAPAQLGLNIGVKLTDIIQETACALAAQTPGSHLVAPVNAPFMAQQLAFRRFR